MLVRGEQRWQHRGLEKGSIVGSIGVWGFRRGRGAALVVGLEQNGHAHGAGNDDQSCDARLSPCLNGMVCRPVRARACGELPCPFLPVAVLVVYILASLIVYTCVRYCKAGIA